MKTKKALELALESQTSLTFEDVTIIPQYADFHPSEVELTTYFSRNTKLKIPIVSAAMDTVTEYNLAIEMAKVGGLGIIHKNLSPQEQTHHVRKVKRHLNGLIELPAWVESNQTLKQITEKYQKEDGTLPFHTFPVLNEESKLIGILGEDSFEFDESSEIASNSMFQQTETAPEGTTIGEAYQRMKEKRLRALPITNPNGELRGLYVFSDVKRIIEGGAESYNVDKKGRLKVGAAIGVYDFERLEKLLEAEVDVVVIDTAHGDSKEVIETLKKIKRDYQIDVVAGNISNGKAVKRLAEAGADGIKIGQGPGSICTTRIVTGAGRAQITAIYDCVKQAEKYGIPTCADGGLQQSGDITKAIVAGANCVMIGSMLAGTEEAPGEIIFFKNRQWKMYRGMGSLGAMKEYQGSRERYQQTGEKKLVPEGVEGMEPYKGPLKEIIDYNIGGLRSGMGYAGAKNIEQLRNEGDFDRVTPSAKQESHPHDIFITKEAPNYFRSQGEQNGY